MSAGCVSNMGGLIIQFKGDGANVEHFYLNISEIKITNANEKGTWITIDNSSKSVDLFSMSNSPETIGQLDLAAGRYSGIRLKIDEATAIIHGSYVMLDLSNETKQYVDITTTFEIKGGKTTTILINLDSEKSIIIVEDDSALLSCGIAPKVYKLQPFISSIDVDTI
jgi:hypothetical protein|tara:strand:- start:1001 stop:1501 length:501 start_codon:yes stop_codon:yes gene_type:complete